MPTKITEMLSGCEIATLESGVPVAEHMYNQGRQPPVTLISIALRNLKPDLENIIKETGTTTERKPWEMPYLDKGLEKEAGRERNSTKMNSF